MKKIRYHFICKKEKNSNNNDKRTFTATTVEGDIKFSRYSHTFFPAEKKRTKTIKKYLKMRGRSLLNLTYKIHK